MTTHRRHQRLWSNSRSTPNFAAIREDGPLSPQPAWSPPKIKHSRYSPTQHRRPPTFTAGTPSEPVSADEKDESSSTHSASSFERDLLSRTTSYSDSASTTDDEDPNTHPTNHLLSRSTSNRPPVTRSQSSLGSSAFAPPFYNRPPTPLPPSPSLTSLLRPRPFLSPSRPTTPDSSDTEATGALSTTYGSRTAYSSTSLPHPLNTPSATTSTAGLVAASALHSSGPVPRASPKLPTNEYYGFVLYLGSSVAFFLYLLWSYLPTPFLHQLGIYYYPDRWWSLAVPSWLVVAIVWTYVALASYNTGYLTLPLKSLEALVDEKGRIAVVDEKGRIVKEEKSRRVRGKEGKDAGTYGNRKQRKKREKERRRERERERVADFTERRFELQWGRLWGEGTDAVMDVPVGGVCEVLYGDGREGLRDGRDDVDEGRENG